MPTVDQWIPQAIRIAIAVAIVSIAATTFRHFAVRYNAEQVNRVTSSTDFRLYEHQGLRKVLGIERGVR